MNDIVYAALYALYTAAMSILLVLLGERWQNRLYKDEGWSGYEEEQT